MIKSMTAFGRAKKEGVDKDVTVEIRSVNSRFFDCTVKLPRSYSFLEEKIKSYVQKKGISRAKIDVSLTVDSHGSDVGAIVLDKNYAEKYLAALRDLRDSFGLSDDISVMSVARNPEVFTSERAEADMSAEWERVLPVLDEALASHSAMREAEGDRIRADVIAKLEAIRERAAEVEKISESDTVGYRDKLEERLRKILSDASVSVDENRLLTECAVWADKIAID
jgi:uncharacterized protein (TIGR00255 family)